MAKKVAKPSSEKKKNGEKNKQISNAKPKKISMPGIALPDDPSQNVKRAGRGIMKSVVKNDLDFEKELEARYDHIASSLNIEKKDMDKTIKSRLGTKIKTYMNDVELHRLFWLVITAIEFEHVRFNMASGITKDEHTHLKRSMTEMWKFILKYMKRMDVKEVKKLLRKVDSSAIRVLTYRELEMMGSIVDNQTKMIFVRTESLYDLSNETMVTRCQNCTQPWGTCDFHDVLDELHIPGSGWGLTSCKYSFNQSDDSIAHAVKVIREVKRQRLEIIKMMDEKYGRTNENDETVKLMWTEIKGLNVAMSELFKSADGVFKKEHPQFKDTEWTDEEIKFYGL